MTLRNILTSVAAGLLMGAAAGPDQAVAEPSFPLAIDFNYCWGSTDPCPRTYIDVWNLFDDNTWRSDSGFEGGWSWTKSSRMVTI